MSIEQTRAHYEAMAAEAAAQTQGVDGIQILDVIAKPYADWSPVICYSLIVDRMPEWIYHRTGNSLVAKDDGFYDFLEIKPGSTAAFAGRAFDITLDDGSTLQCRGQVWSCASPADVEPTIDVGVATLDKLRKCYVFASASVSKSKLAKWLSANTPSNNYDKYDERSTVAWLDQHRGFDSRRVCANRARKLRRRGVIVWRDAAGNRLWSPWYERRRAEIMERRANDPGSVHLAGGASHG